MENYYSLLGLDSKASRQSIKQAFRERAKKLHPDIAGKSGEAQMRRLLAAYQVLADRERRFEYDRAYSRFVGAGGFDYRTFLRARSDPASQAKRIFFEFLHLGDDEAIRVWDAQGALDFRLEKYLEREDYLDCAFLLAEELERRGRVYEAFVLLAALVREERRRPYFKHFMPEIETMLKELVRRKLKAAVGGWRFVECLETLLTLGFGTREQYRWKVLLAETLYSLGETRNAEALLKSGIFRAAV
ncbi:MAG: DnaJ domain-containing protein [Treponema sp.]|jgi:curved DNA-binding protein CbpA|nr:DnaJ domain-containing protein [Treponema sp.]